MSATAFLLIANIFQFLANLGDIVYPPLGIFATFWTLRGRSSEDNATINSTPRPTDSEFSPASIDLCVVPEEPLQNWVKACRTSLKEILESLDDILKKGLLDGTETKKRFMQLIDMQESLGVIVSNLARCVKDGIDPGIRRSTVHSLLELEQDVDDLANTIERSRLKREVRCGELSNAEEGLLSPLWTRPSSKDACDARRQLDPEPETPSELPAIAKCGSMVSVQSHMHLGSSDVEIGSSICDQRSPLGVSTKLDDTGDHGKVQRSFAWRGRNVWVDEIPETGDIGLYPNL